MSSSGRPAVRRLAAGRGRGRVPPASRRVDTRLGDRAERALAAAQATFLAGAFEAVQRLLATAEAHPLDGFQRARAALLRGQLAVVLGYGRDAPPLLLDAARQLEPFDVELARGAYLTAYGAGMAAAHLGDSGVFLEICRSAANFLATQGTACIPSTSCSKASPGCTPTVALSRFRSSNAPRAGLRNLPAADVVRWGWTTPMASNVMWDSEASTAIFERQARIVREAGALAELPVFLSSVAIDKLWNGDLAGAEAFIAESDSVAAATGSQLPPFATLRLLSSAGQGIRGFRVDGGHADDGQGRRERVSP